MPAAASRRSHQARGSGAGVRPEEGSGDWTGETEQRGESSSGGVQGRGGEKEKRKEITTHAGAMQICSLQIANR